MAIMFLIYTSLNILSSGVLEIFGGIEIISIRKIHAKYLQCLIIMSKCKIDEIEIVISVELIGVQSIENMRHKNIDLKSESISGDMSLQF